MEKTAFVLGSEHWEKDFYPLLKLVKNFILEVWEFRKQKIYGYGTGASQYQSQFSAGSLDSAGSGEGKLCSCKQSQSGKCCCVHAVVCVKSMSVLDCSAQNVECVVHGRNAKTLH